MLVRLRIISKESMLIFKIRIKRQKCNKFFIKYCLNDQQLYKFLKRALNKKYFSIYLISIKFHSITFNSRIYIKDQNNKLSYYHLSKPPPLSKPPTKLKKFWSLAFFIFLNYFFEKDLRKHNLRKLKKNY